MKIILASASPRRFELLKIITENFDVISPNVDETIDSDCPPQKAVVELANAKAVSVFSEHNDSIVIGADTIVVINDEILGKPTNNDDAKNMLQKLSGKKHTVYTGVSILTPNTEINFLSKTDVFFEALSDEEIFSYIETGEPLDKAGAYGIQGYGSRFIKEIYGDYYSVMGLPINRLYNELKNIKNF